MAQARFFKVLGVVLLVLLLVQYSRGGGGGDDEDDDDEEDVKKFVFHSNGEEFRGLRSEDVDEDDHKINHTVVVSVLANSRILQEGVKVEVFIQSHPVEHAPSVAAPFVQARSAPTWNSAGNYAYTTIDPATLSQYTGAVCTDDAKAQLDKAGCKRGDDQHCGHLIAKQMGGPGNIKNVFCQSYFASGLAWDKYETDITNCLYYGKVGLTTLEWTLEGTNLFLPSSVTYSVTYTKPNGICQSGSKPFPNI